MSHGQHRKSPPRNIWKRLLTLLKVVGVLACVIVAAVVIYAASTGVGVGE